MNVHSRGEATARSARREGQPAEPALRLLGAVLAGGESRRFGSDKAAATVGGRSLVDRATRALSAACPEVVVVSARAIDTDVPVVADRRGPCGPLGGIETALATADDHGLDGAFVLACDLPLVTPATVARIVGALEAEPAALAAAPRGVGGRRAEPLCAAYRLGCAETARALLDSGRLEAAALLEGVSSVLVGRPEGELVNVNTPTDRDVVERALRERAG